MTFRKLFALTLGCVILGSIFLSRSISEKVTDKPLFEEQALLCGNFPVALKSYKDKFRIDQVRIIVGTDTFQAETIMTPQGKKFVASEDGVSIVEESQTTLHYHGDVYPCSS